MNTATSCQARFRLVAAAVITAAMGGAVLASPASAATVPRPQADYLFDNSMTSAIAGAPDLVDIEVNGENLFVSDGPPIGGTLRFQDGNGIRANSATVVPRDRYTIAVTVFFDDVDGIARILRFKPNGSAQADTGLYVSNGDLAFVGAAPAAGAPTFADMTFADVVITRAANGRVRGYVDGVQQFSFLDNGRLATISANGVLRFFQDNGDGQDSAGAVARLRMWDVALTPTQVSQLRR